ncbi:MAG: RES domain-containing protein [Sphaerochaetaceae bacterium]
MANEISEDLEDKLEQLTDQKLSQLLKSESVSNYLIQHPSEIAPLQSKIIQRMSETIKDYLPGYDKNVIAIDTNNNNLLTMRNLEAAKEAIKLHGFNGQSEEDMNRILKEYNQEIEKFELPINQINFIRNSVPDLMGFEEGVKRFFDEAYKDIPIGSRLKVVKEKEKFVPIVETNIGDEYKLSSQPIVDSIPKVFKKINESDTINFINFLENFPFLAMEDEVGKKIYEELNMMADQMCILVPRHTEFYRCRKWEKRQSTPYTDLDMFAPYRAVAKAARFNNFGVNHLYMANSEKTAKDEIGRCKKYNTLRAKNRNELHLLDLAPEMNIIFNYCLRGQRDKAFFPREYLMPNFISQCCAYLNQYEYHQIDGIRYPSTKNPSEYSFVLFNKSKDSFVDIRLS